MTLPECSESERHDLALLETRIGSSHMRKRLAIEGRREPETVGTGGAFGPVERRFSRHGLMRTALTWSGLRGRGRRNVLDIQVRHNEVRLSRLPLAFDGYTLLHLSDLHLDMDAAFQDRLVERVQGLAHDACVLTGDYRFRSYGPYDPALQALARLRPQFGEHVYAVLGNHDTIRIVPGMERLGYRMLMNESVRLERAGATLPLAGIDDAHYFRTHDVQKAAAGKAPGDCAILLSHTPATYRLAAEAGFDLMLCGHTHGGQICLPGGVPVLTDCDAPRAFMRGPWQYRQMRAYTSVGCGASIIDMRLNCLPEITLHRLRRG